VVVVSYNTAHLLDQMFAALEAGRGALKLQVVVVDNASRDGSADFLRTKYPDVELIENRTNVGFGRANNQALGTRMAIPIPISCRRVGRNARSDASEGSRSASIVLPHGGAVS